MHSVHRGRRHLLHAEALEQVVEVTQPVDAFQWAVIVAGVEPIPVEWQVHIGDEIGLPQDVMLAIPSDPNNPVRIKEYMGYRRAAPGGGTEIVLTPPVPVGMKNSYNTQPDKSDQVHFCTEEIRGVVKMSEVEVEVSYPWMWMGTEMFFDLTKAQRAAVLAWLAVHDQKRVKEWMATEKYLHVTKYKVNEKGSHYIVNCKGLTRAEDPEHPPFHDDDWSCWHAAREKVTVPLKSPPPVVINGTVWPTTTGEG